MAVQPRVRYYREFLTPALHRRFTSAAVLTLLVCYVEAIIIGEKSSFLWSWFPLGTAGLRTLLLWISSLSIFVLRVVQLHFGARTADSPAKDALNLLTSLNIIRTFVFYIFSAWWFGEVYIWSASANENLVFVREGKSYERPQLNERSIYLRCFVLILAVVQSLLHLALDEGRVCLPYRPTSEAIPPPLQRLKRIAPNATKVVLSVVLCTSVAGPLVYMIAVRWVAWPWSLFMARLVWNIPQGLKPSILPLLSPFLISRSAMMATLLLCLWATTNAAFGAYVAQEPLKNGQPLTDDSRDPNGSLLNGLKSRKEATKTFAFWELLYISQRFDARRKSIFAEFDRSGGSTWTQILSASLETIQAITTRILMFQTPSSANPAPKQEVKHEVEIIPSIASPLRQDNILARAPPSSWTASTAKSLGQSRSSSGALSPQAKGYLSTARQKLIKQLPDSTAPTRSLASMYQRVLESPFGYPFRHTFARRVNSIIFESPNSDMHQIIHAIDSISSLTAASLTEDQYGTVSKDILTVIRTFVATLGRIDAFVQGLPVHWADLDFEERDGSGRKVEEVELVTAHLKTGLKQLIDVFGNYAPELGLGKGELRDAKRIAGL